MNLHYGVKLTIPSTDYATPVDATVFNSRIAEACFEFCKLYGGASATRGGQGYYIAQDGTLIIEETATVSAFCDDWKLEELQPLLDKWKQDWKQETLLIEYLDGQNAVIA